MKILLALALLVGGCAGGPQVIDGYTFDPGSTCQVRCEEMSNAVRAWAGVNVASVEFHRPVYGDGNLRQTSGSGYYVAVVKLADGSTKVTAVTCSMGCTAGVSLPD